MKFVIGMRLIAAVAAILVGAVLVTAFASTSESVNSGVADDGQPGPAIAEALRRFVRDTRAHAGVPALEVDPALRRAAESQALAIAARPSNKRLAERTSLAERLSSEGIVDYADAHRHLDLKKGYASLATAHGASWRERATSWNAVLDPRTDALELAVVRTGDGWSVLVALSLDRGRGIREPSAVARRIHDRANEIRVEHGLTPLEWNDRLATIARAHSEEMARKGRLAHRSRITGGPSDRVDAAGIAWRKVAENLWLGKTVEDPAEGAIEGWMTSPGHRRNLLDPIVRESGVGVVLRADGTWYATQLYLRARP